MSGAEQLSVHGLTVRYGQRKVLDQFDLPSVHPGVMGLLGPNAAGKSTLLRALAGLQPAQGMVRLGSLDLMKCTLAEHARHVTYMPQSLPQGVFLTVLEAMLSAILSSPVGGMGHAQAQAHALATLNRLGLGELAMRPLAELSGGQRQLASLAQAIARNPRVLLLDEPTSALDIRHQWRVMHEIKEIAAERGIIVLVVLHDIALACRWCDRIALLSGGRLIADGPPPVAVTPETIRSVYGVRVRVETCSRGAMQIIVDGEDETLAGVPA